MASLIICRSVALYLTHHQPGVPEMANSELVLLQAQVFFERGLWSIAIAMRVRPN
ncbi:hypothetical protein J5X98_04635 [Leptothermofonsia sichuanensis E412]|uniref:hypothetical protein n=1 Tax=Leptothermofonsia sichuanensis TaxID=2917832 RepID=UPI001CA5F5DC|nr:hypothetical protein [Leptothermofonsia sichuanensis]QZZ21737.1 hypothetical protein J5X98_04635 [Leptothermofonsia sichuanensis E412]